MYLMRGAIMDRLIKKIDTQSKLITKSAPTLQVAINIPNLKLNYNFSTTSIDQKFHSASVGKLVTSTLLFILIEQNKLSLETKISQIINDGVLDKLFVYKKVDYKNEVTIKHLLSHTSGLNGYLEGHTIDKSVFTNDLIKQPNKLYTPKDLIEFTRVHQRAVGKPGDRFFYSDTGYVLLGLIIEKITRMSFSDAIDNYIFQPLNMNNTGQCFYHKDFDPEQLAPIKFNDKNIAKFKSLSCFFSGGGLFTTTHDLTLFLKALMGHQLIKEDSLKQMEDFKYPMHRAMYYGLGLMQIRFEKFFFLLKNMPRLQGHLGILGVHAWYDKETKDTYVINVGSNKDMIRSFQYLINIINIIEKEKKLSVKK